MDIAVEVAQVKDATLIGAYKKSTSHIGDIFNVEGIQRSAVGRIVTAGAMRVRISW